MSDELKVHLGCGKRYIPGFVHVDLAEFPHIDYHGSLHKLAFGDNTVDLIYCCHALTYYDLQDIKEKVLPEWLRVLKPGGTVRISVTDFERMICLYETKHDITNILGPVFGRWELRGAMIYHKTIFDAALLRKTLIEAGFDIYRVRLWDWRKTEHADVDDYSQAYYPHMDKENGMLISLNMEADKPQ